ncbi:AraC family transcriptional regulator [Spongiibacter sp. KMU-158]|uniref:AraC family transcriptional regulator n=1 Tax=Spongiibacter pelagi TaxID=2760804 RepID=A0A927C446_9GAMM|nr:AraC family transcriptional regulator [Spongiibacter pelagi]MBD2859401.1 AraC family transcriptional regulator [Spongiibacter pelagi]
MSEKTTVTLSYTQGIFQAAERRGIVLPASLLNGVKNESRIPMDIQDAIWESYCALAADELAGLRLGLELQVGHLDLVGMLLMSCETLGEAIELLLDYHPIVGEGGDFSLSFEGANCLLVYEPRYDIRRRERVETVMACVLNMARWVTGDHFQIRRVQFIHDSAGAAAQYEPLLNASVHFNAPSNALVFDPALQAMPLIQANRAMRDQLRVLADQMLQELERIGLSADVQSLIRLHPSWGKERIAECLGMSGRHLVRKLQEEGTTFKLLRSRLLQKLAEEQLLAGSAVIDVAEALGFSDESAFGKAFKRWAGITPALFRDSQASH